MFSFTFSLHYLSFNSFKIQEISYHIIRVSAPPLRRSYITKRVFHISQDSLRKTILNRLPIRCVYSLSFDIQHALSCKNVGFVTSWHNLQWNTTAALLSEACKDVEVEPTLARPNCESLFNSTNTSNEARLDISMRGFCQKAFFDVKVFNPKAEWYEKRRI